MRRNRFIALLLACAALMVLVAAGCGSDDDDGGGGAAPGTEETGATEGAEVIDPNSMEGAKGEVTYCQGKDTAGNAHEMIDLFNEKYESQGLTAKLVEFPASADEQRNQFIQRQQAKSGDCDVFSADVIWTAEFASQKWIFDLTPYIETKDDYIDATLETVTYDGKIWGAPETTDAAFLYYRTDMVDQAPTTWQELYASAKEDGGMVFQGAAYEGLTCDFLEVAFAAGGEVLNEDGTEAVFDSPENVEALTAMVEATQGGAAPRAVTTYMEPESLAAFQTGKYAYMRNWPYAFALNQKAGKVKGKFEVAPLPSWEGGEAASILGGHNSVISVFSENPGGALTMVDFISSPEIQSLYASKFSLAPTTSAAYDDPAVKKALPFSAELKQAVEQARSRPVSPVYPQISQAIYKNVNAALAGQTSPEEAVKQAQADIEQALATF
jgi:multiple sugar transport system substrate-binding protein